MSLLFIFDMDDVLYDYDWRLRMSAMTEITGLPLDERDFAAHVTLLRDARCEELPAFETIVWPVGEFVLAASTPQGGGHYEIVGRWPLAEG